jgi:hypothetical protein
MDSRPIDPISVPLRYPTSTIYLDDSGAKVLAGKLLVIAGIKVRRHGELLRAIRHVRDQTGFTGEFKFREINKGSVSAYYELIRQLEESDAHIVGSVTSRPPGAKQPLWRFYAEVTAQLLRGAIVRRELVSVLMDHLPTPRKVALEDVVRGMVNKPLGNMAVVTAVSLDSRSSDGLQMADLVAGAIAFERRRVAGESGSASSMKARVVNQLKASFGTDLLDCRTERVNIQTYRQKPRLSAVEHQQKAG